MKIFVVLNPYANRWGARRKRPMVEEALNAAGIEFELQETTVRGHATRLARSAAEGDYDAVIAAGGDGTLHEVINGLVQAAGEGPTKPFGILPIGTGNDFASSAKIPQDLEQAVQILQAAKTEQVDLATFNGRMFINNCAAAMEPLVTIEAEGLQRLSGSVRYIVALIKALLKLKAWQMHVKWDSGEFLGPVYLLSVCNGIRTGGSFIMAPQAQISDGLLDFVLVPEVPMRTVFAILPRLFTGSHIKHEKVTYLRTTHLEISSRPGTPVHADGEVLEQSINKLDYTVLPGKLTLLCSA